MLTLEMLINFYTYNANTDSDEEDLYQIEVEELLSFSKLFPSGMIITIDNIKSLLCANISVLELVKMMIDFYVYKPESTILDCNEVLLGLCDERLAIFEKYDLKESEIPELDKMDRVKRRLLLTELKYDELSFLYYKYMVKLDNYIKTSEVEVDY